VTLGPTPFLIQSVLGRGEAFSTGLRETEHFEYRDSECIELFLHSPIRFHGAVLKHRDNFTFSVIVITMGRFSSVVFLSLSECFQRTHIIFVSSFTIILIFNFVYPMQLRKCREINPDSHTNSPVVIILSHASWFHATSAVDMKLRDYIQTHDIRLGFSFAWDASCFVWIRCKSWHSDEVYQ
jgi:hypothetical protein